ncbi:MAG: hypothetical protein J1G02_03605 [Clostridiales bacterium]|nr:hypothetical protein [Clostridiales bacterium]
MLDIIILLACATCGFVCGRYLEKRIKRKGDFYSDLQRYVSLLKVNVEGKQVELAVFNEEFVKNSSDSFCKYINEGKLKCALSSLQRDNIDAFFNNIGCVNSQELIRHIDYYATVFASDAKKVSEEVNKAAIYTKLGVLLGVMVGIVLM